MTPNPRHPYRSRRRHR